MIDFARKNNKFRAESMKFSSIPPDFSSKLGGFDDFLLDSAQILYISCLLLHESRHPTYGYDYKYNEYDNQWHDKNNTPFGRNITFQVLVVSVQFVE